MNSIKIPPFPTQYTFLHVPSQKWIRDDFWYTATNAPKWRTRPTDVMHQITDNFRMYFMRILLSTRPGRFPLPPHLQSGFKLEDFVIVTNKEEVLTIKEFVEQHLHLLKDSRYNDELLNYLGIANVTV